MNLGDGGASGGAERSTAEADENSSFEDDDEDYEEAEGGNRLFGFMFGNVDDSGDLDADYLDEDAKDHLGALADKLGPSLTGIDLSEKTQRASDAANQDYRKKAEDAIDYEDIDEEYDGPEVEAATEEDFVAEKVLVTSAENRTSVFDDENYDEEDDDLEKQNISVEANATDEKTYAQEELSQQISQQENNDMLEMENSDSEEPGEDDSNVSDSSMSDDLSSVLPVLYEEEGKAILKFSEIFGIRESIKRAEKRESKYIISRDKYKSMNPSDIVEEDEGGYLEVPSKDVSWMRRFHSRRDAYMSNDECETKSATVKESGTIWSSETGDRRKDNCALAEPMKADAPLHALSEQILHFSDQLCPLDQENWEDRILWDNSPSLGDSFVETCELSGPDSDIISDDKVNRAKTKPHTRQIKLQSEVHDNDHASFLHSCSILVEPFGAHNYSRDTTDLPMCENRSNPQLLRLESNVEPEGANDVSNEAKVCSEAMRRFSKLTLQNRDVLNGSWLDRIVWEPGQPVAKPKLILDLQDDQMLFEISDTDDDRHLQRHAGAMILSRSLLTGSGNSPVQQHGRGISAPAKFNISNDKFYSSRKSSQQLRSHSKKRSIHGLKILHSVPALKLQTMKAKLSNKDIANFHRPKAIWYPHDIEVPFVEQGKFSSWGQMKIIVKSLGGKGTKLHVDPDETISITKAKASKKLDFKLSEPVKIIYSGRELEDSKTLAEQYVHPNSVLHLIRTKIHLLPRAQKLPGENKSLHPPGAFKKKSDLSVKDGHVFLMEYCEERPLLLGNPGMGARLCTYYQKSTPSDQNGNLMRNANTGFGSIVVLDPADKSPFLGDIKPGSSQSGIETNMFRAPIFQHKVPSTDYLLVRSAKGKLSLRRIDRIDVVGQQEPHIEVMTPGSKAVQLYIMNRLLVYMYREFSACEKRGVRPSIRADEFSKFPIGTEAFLRKRLKNCADLQRERSGDFIWVMKRNFRIPSEEELRRMVTPENVCAYESMLAGQYRLKRLGITSLTLPTGISSAVNQLPGEALPLAAASHIERELLITPWNLSSNFVSSTNQDRENIERLEITGMGDPSGRGLGFSYVRATPKAVANTVTKKKTVVSKGTTVTGTDADLRRLSMEAARELLLKFNVPEEQIAKLTRWHRIALIRNLSSEQAASGATVDPTTVSKFARGQRMSFLQLQQQTREKCQEVWDRQVQSLYSGDGEENESEAEANSDLDSFAGDLENLLDAEELEEGDEVNHESKPGSIDGVKGLRMRRLTYQTLTDKEIEDEKAEAEELRRILMEDDETDRKKKKKADAVVGKTGAFFKPKHDPQNAYRNKSPAPKRIAEVPFVPPGKISMDHKEADSLMMPRNNLVGKLKPKKKDEIEQTGLLNKKIKILGDGRMMGIKEKKSARDSFVCGACGQPGHMRTNKNCPKYGEDSETRNEAIDFDKSLVRPNLADQAEQSHQKPFPKKLHVNGLKIAGAELGMEDDKLTTPRAKFLKVKCSGSTDMPHDKLTSPDSQGSDRPFMTTTYADPGNKLKVSKVTFSSKTRSEDGLSEPHRPSIVIKPPVDSDRDQPPKKIVFKQSKELYNQDDNSQDGSFGFDYQKTKTMNELSGSNPHFEIESHFEGEWSRMRHLDGGSSQWLVGGKVERARTYEPQPTFELPKYEEDIRREREERQRANTNKKKKRKLEEAKDDYLDVSTPRSNNMRSLERERTTRARPEPSSVKHTREFSHAPKRRRGGEVSLSNLLEAIVDTLRNRIEISFLFLKPVTKKVAPDYLTIISHPMDLATIRDKVRRMEYKNRDEFRHDVYQIVYNAHKYNDNRNPHIPPLADQLLELCDYLLDQYQQELDEAEAGILND